jgi:DMSO/TMAO reductase YedYZ heme-binding membrane subunit
VKIDVSQPLVYAAILAALLGLRLVFWLRQRAAPRRAARR